MIRTPAQQAPLVEFKAGALYKSGTTVTADDRKGLIQITHDPDLDGCAKLKWLDRRSRNTLDELMIFPNDAEWVKVPQCKDGRVYVLKFKGSDRRFFFWMQEPNEEKDEEYAAAVNKAIRNEEDGAAEPAGVDMTMATESTVADETPESVNDAVVAASSGDDSSTVPMETDPTTNTSTSGEGGAADASAPAGGQSVSAEVTQLANILGNATKYQQQLSEEQGINLNDVLSTDTMLSLVDNPQFRNSVLEHMPESAEKTPEEFKALVSSPQFQEALRSFQQALQIGQLGPVMEQFGLDANAGALGSIQAFVDALAKHTEEKTPDGAASKE